MSELFFSLSREQESFEMKDRKEHSPFLSREIEFSVTKQRHNCPILCRRKSYFTYFFLQLIRFQMMSTNSSRKKILSIFSAVFALALLLHLFLPPLIIFLLIQFFLVTVSVGTFVCLSVRLSVVRSIGLSIGQSDFAFFLHC